jgi:D-cysteine desulfhydrase
MSNPVLFEAFPDLKGKLAWIPLGSFPTPVERLEHIGLDNLWIKRDDKSSNIYGGNKVRKLEFVLGDVVRKKKRHVITFGGIGTNHGLATAIFCRQLGIACTLLLFYQPVTAFVQQNMLLFRQYGSTMIHTRTLPWTVVHFYILQRLIHPGAYFLFAGGSSPVGTLGFVNAAFELREQIRQGQMPTPDYIICPVGSNGTMAGLSLGMLLAGLPTQVIGIRVAASHLGPFEACTPGTVRTLMKQTLAVLKKGSDRIPNHVIGTQRIIGDYFGDGYGHPTPGGLQAIKIMHERTGIKLEPTYTGKTFAAVMDFAHKEENSASTILYWHTYNSVDLKDQASAVDYHDLPRTLHSFFEKTSCADSLQ